MTPPEDQNGQYGAAYPGTGHDAFGGPAGGYAPAPGYAGYNQAPLAGQSGYWQDQQPQEWQPQSQPSGRPHAPVEMDQDDEPLIRPYAMTGGRTRPRYQLAIEALVSTTAAPERIGSLLPEHQRICSLCTDIKSVAEISALLSMPLGVARILVADLAESGLVAIHQPAAGGESGGTPDVTLLERVLSGLRKL
ncbi:DUF742 domain-containing protein [Streptacidiphilus melanogenes]|uniref:DUF742 domain-containing protein n=1 Tax=Streptacidiphilus melanogenes TaxID=411235 RepID=UPI000A074DA3|nr:DUF742 domain-containing protein [Streptacidiphilus melanogenes]